MRGHLQYNDTIFYNYFPNKHLESKTINSFYMGWEGNWERYWHKYEYEYDTKWNYILTKHYPKEYLFIESLEPTPDYSSNNIILETHTTSNGNYEADIRNITSYNSAGFPLTMTTSWGSIELEYDEK